MTVEAGGRLERVEATSSRPDGIEAAVDVRPWVLMPGLIDLHAHLPQLPNADREIERLAAAGARCAFWTMLNADSD